ncbi:MULTISPECIES: glycerol-3-phosphate 1-O-acyltransferase PlsY [Helicobacter]|uniref:Glycerol-3-phosphate acyltransferase n=3 Tax=Helicobacter typhlonius TaxID=76936 RepID=A0A099UEG2_9HELI|nr:MULTISPECIES: glycerol-3-phosphate 1-O-acyltransferase PlsY [Helicobacter]TLD78356.1 glycerol-3-phosphate 1-O-acyltransferase PlsY [Helicobacter typhlonius]TLD87096.1 glycerol-3-phosphate 1-O-acyltransferase PlsY [Helicobacter sp. MIT 03-1616]CUU39170.1 Acyl-phosphate:glycerol-3-phosphate O-acyltransferase PlsY [Helicobacter typhlonius]HCD73615.1 glycerol-3-phosphate 1-O-acyltransferase PlsY [Helicobacter sp.]
MSVLSSLLYVFSNINVIFYVLAFIVGGIPFGWLLLKVLYKTDIRQIGSGSIGATNVYRTLKERDEKKAKPLSILTIVLDASKGLIMVALAKAVGLSYETQWAIALLAIIGHCYSPYLGFKGGKGVATAIGSVLLLIPVEGICGLIVWGIVGKVFKISSLSSLIGVLSGIVLTFVIPYILPLPDSISIVAQIHTHTPVVLIGLFILYTHIPNIKRLFSGQEGKVL